MRCAAIALYLCLATLLVVSSVTVWCLCGKVSRPFCRLHPVIERILRCSCSLRFRCPRFSLCPLPGFSNSCGWHAVSLLPSIQTGTMHTNTHTHTHTQKDKHPISTYGKRHSHTATKIPTRCDPAHPTLLPCPMSLPSWLVRQSNPCFGATFTFGVHRNPLIGSDHSTGNTESDRKSAMIPQPLRNTKRTFR